MRSVVCSLIAFCLMSGACFAADQAKIPETLTPKLEKPRECSSCTARHQALLRKKKQREQAKQKATSPAAPPTE